MTDDDALEVPCARCGEPVFQHDRRCEHCGVWFAGDALEFAPPEDTSDLDRRRRRRVMAFGLALLLVVSALVALGVAQAVLERP